MAIPSPFRKILDTRDKSPNFRKELIPRNTLPFNPKGPHAVYPPVHPPGRFPDGFKNQINPASGIAIGDVQVFAVPGDAPIVIASVLAVECVICMRQGKEFP